MALLAAIMLGALPLDHRGMAWAIVAPAVWLILISLVMLRSKHGATVVPANHPPDA